MPGNSFGEIFRITSFGESHGPAIGVVIDGCMPGLTLNVALIENELRRRRPGQSDITTSRNEQEEIEILSGLFEGVLTGAPLAIIVRNKDPRSSDYDALKDAYRPSHADYTYDAKYGIRDHRGGGRQSARETVARVIAGAVAKQHLQEENISVTAFVSQVHNIRLEAPYQSLNLEDAEKNIMRCPDPAKAREMISAVEAAKADGDSVGGIITCVCRNVMPGLGEPVFDKLHADLAKAIMSINACKGFDVGSGFDSVLKKGSENNDAFIATGGAVSTAKNNSGGVQGGISNGQDIVFRAAFKPTSTIRKEQETVTSRHERVNLKAAGRHDPCVVPRAVPIVEAMAAVVLLDHLMRNRIYRNITTRKLIP